MSLGWGLTAYHLDRLIKDGALERIRTGRRDFFFSRELASEARVMVVALHSPTERAILLHLARAPDRTFSEILVDLRLSKSVLSFHLRLLLANQLVIFAPESATRRYRIRHSETVLSVFAAYQAAWGSAWTDGFAGAFGALARE